MTKQRSQAEEALEIALKRWQDTFDAISDGVWVLDNEGRIIQSNGIFERLLGVETKNVIGQHCYTVAHCTSKFMEKCPFKRMKQTGMREYLELKDKERDLFLQITVDPIRDKSGKIKNAVHIVRDVTEQKRAEEEILLLQILTKAISEADDLNAAIEFTLRTVCETAGWDYGEAWIPCQNGTALECSPVWYRNNADIEKFRILRENFKFLSGTGLPGRVYSSKRPEWLPDVSAVPDSVFPHASAAKEAGLKSGLGVPIISNNRALAVLVFSTLEFHNSDKRLVDIVSAVAIQLGSVIQRKQAEEQIREQAELINHAHDAIGVRDLEHNLIYWNKGAEHLYGWTAEEVIGKNADELLYKEESSALIEAKKSVIDRGKWIGELRQRTKDGKEIIVESRWSLMCDYGGKPKSILIINTDITEKKKLESQLLRAQRMESIGTLAGGIAHDLNNVLTPIMLSLQMFKEKFKDEESQKLFTLLEKNSQRGANLIKQVLSFARGIEGERNALQVKHLIFEIEKVVQETFPRNIEIKTNIPKDLWTILGDATQLHQVIMNLCVNARDAMPHGGILSITASNFFVDANYAWMNTEAKVGPYIVIAVSDTGTGIPSEILDRIFEPFFTTKEHGKGTGLGLSTVQAIVKSHGGFINVYSEMRKGTTFRIYLPSIKTEIQNAEEQKLELLVGHGELVLVAEDEASISEITSSTLKTYGYKVLIAGDGARAVALYAQNKDIIKVVLLDMMMPVMDGYESIRVIRRINPLVKIVAVSGLAEKDKLKKIAEANVQAFLPKPYTAEKLLKTIHEVLSIGKEQ